VDLMGIGAAMTRILLVDDHDMVRDVLRGRLNREPDLEVVAEAGTAADALERVRSSHPDVVVLDVRLPDRSGVEVCRDIRSEHTDVAVLMLTASADNQAVFDAIMAGASGYVLKKIRGNGLVDGIRRVAAGESMLDPALTASVLDRIRHPTADGGAWRLTATESRIIELVADGETNREIGERVGLAEMTVKNHVSSILAKLQLSRQADEATYLAEQRARLDRMQR
jgi:DNA-binding NarL/FixJ family response regulator